MQAVPTETGLEGFKSASPSQIFEVLAAKYLNYSGDNRRREPRHPLHTNIRLWLDDAVEQACVSIDVSPGGLGVLCGLYIPPGTAVRIGFTSLDKRLVVAGVVRDSLFLDGDFHLVGIQFTES